MVPCVLIYFWFPISMFWCKKCLCKLALVKTCFLEVLKTQFCEHKCGPRTLSDRNSSSKSGKNTRRTTQNIIFYHIPTDFFDSQKSKNFRVFDFFWSDPRSEIFQNFWTKLCLNLAKLAVANGKTHTTYPQEHYGPFERILARKRELNRTVFDTKSHFLGTLKNPPCTLSHTLLPPPKKRDF